MRKKESWMLSFNCLPVWCLVTVIVMWLFGAVNWSAISRSYSFILPICVFCAVKGKRFSKDIFDFFTAKYIHHRKGSEDIVTKHIRD